MCQFTVPVALLTVFGEIQVPLRDALHGGVPSGDEGAEQVERGGRLRVGADHPLRVGDAALLVERVAVDVVAPVAGQLHPIPHLERVRPRLRELPRHPTNLDDGHLGAEHEDGGHLEEDA
uniref:AROF n=1 Tax=Arundo donax TaxID=35708 RepID=A0A0A9D037_ARUDO